MKARIESSLLLSPRNVLVFLSRNRIKIETSKEEPLALKIEAEAFFLFVCLFQFWQRLVHDIYIYIYRTLHHMGIETMQSFFTSTMDFLGEKTGCITTLRTCEPDSSASPRDNWIRQRILVDSRAILSLCTSTGNGRLSRFEGLPPRTLWRNTKPENKHVYHPLHVRWKDWLGMKRILPEQNSERTIVDASN